MIGSAAIRAQAAAKIRCGEGDDIIGQAELFERPLVSAYGAVQGRKHVCLREDKFFVVVPALVIHKKRLTAQPKLTTDFDRLSHRLEHRPKRVPCKKRVHARAKAGI